MSVFVYRKYLVHFVSLIVAFFVIPSGVLFGSYFARTSERIKTRLVVCANCTGAGTISEAKIYWPECSAQIALYSEETYFFRKLVSR